MTAPSRVGELDGGRGGVVGDSGESLTRARAPIAARSRAPLLSSSSKLESRGLPSITMPALAGRWSAPELPLRRRSGVAGATAGAGACAVALALAPAAIAEAASASPGSPAPSPSAGSASSSKSRARRTAGTQLAAVMARYDGDAALSAARCKRSPALGDPLPGGSSCANPRSTERTAARTRGRPWRSVKALSTSNASEHNPHIRRKSWSSELAPSASCAAASSRSARSSDAGITQSMARAHGAGRRGGPLPSQP
mmetsp:Transcript_22333/g.84726  ORF Transcript_22333/g.84726 Transcript_22333/m.84726 type:complete len:255 (-) Transcript_22333:158-922(-)